MGGKQSNKQKKYINAPFSFSDIHIPHDQNWALFNLQAPYVGEQKDRGREGGREKDQDKLEYVNNEYADLDVNN